MNTLGRQNAARSVDIARGFAEYVEDEWNNFMGMISTHSNINNNVIAKKVVFLLEHADCIKAMNDDMLNQLKGLLTIVSRDSNNNVVM
jgi:hypothetical protein